MRYNTNVNPLATAADTSPEDEELCAAAQNGSRGAEEALVLRYSPLVRYCARLFDLAGGDPQDLVQEGMIGLIFAIRDFDQTKDASFRTYADICVRRRLYSALKSASRGKHSPLNNYLSLESPSHIDRVPDPEELVIGQEQSEELSCALKGLLSKFEAEILGLYLQGLSYREIAAKIVRSPKSVDNAVQRIRRKVARHLSLGDNR